MTLREKLQEEKLYINPHSFKLTKEGAEIFEKIADDYAIEFAEWSVARAMGLDSFKLNNGELETFKKEKVL